MQKLPVIFAQFMGRAMFLKNKIKISHLLQAELSLLKANPKKYYKRFLPNSLFGRSLIIIFLPLLLLQVIAIWVFFDRHINQVTYRLSRALAGEIAFVLEEIERRPYDTNHIFSSAMRNFEFESISLKKGAVITNDTSKSDGYIAQIASRAMTILPNPYRIDGTELRDRLKIEIQLENSVLYISVPGKRIFSVTSIIFILWMIGSSLVLFAIASLFMRNQVRPLTRLAEAVEAFGKGQDTVGIYKPEGAKEVRQAAYAFNRMSERIKRQIRQRTDMLSAISHDLRTPITRMMLQVEFLEDENNKKELQINLHEMQEMIIAYLSFVRGEGDETTQRVNINDLFQRLKEGNPVPEIPIHIHIEGDLFMNAKPIALRRLLDNIIMNAIKYAKTIEIQAASRIEMDSNHHPHPMIEILVDDDGPGIPIDKRELAFQPFMRLDSSRNASTGGTGLGLSIAQDIVLSHGGKISLEDSPLGGLRVQIKIPV